MISKREVTAQCKKCKDIFDITLRNRRGEISLDLTSVATLTRHGLVHRPGHCGGPARVIWSPMDGPMFPEAPSVDPLAPYREVPHDKDNSRAA